MDLSCQHLKEKVGGLGVQGQPRSYENFSKKKKKEGSPNSLFEKRKANQRMFHTLTYSIS